VRAFRRFGTLRRQGFQARVLGLFLGLFTTVQALAFLALNAAHARDARTQIDAALEAGAEVFHRLIQERARRLVDSTRLLSGDFAFKATFANGDPATILSALENHQARIGADMMVLVALDFRVIGDTLHPDSAGSAWQFGARVEAALDRGDSELAAVVLLDGRPFQIVVVPLLAPDLVAWIGVGFRLEEQFTAELRRLTLSHVSLLADDGSPAWRSFASTLPDPGRAALAGAIGGAPWQVNRSLPLRLAGEEFVSLVAPLAPPGEPAVVAVLQRSLEEALRPFYRLRWVLLSLFGAGLVLTALLGSAVARSVTRPVLSIAASARRVEAGDYSQQLQMRQRDEIGELAASFNHMVQGLREKERVRSLLGLVVSPAIAQELLRKEIDLSGEERAVTVLFADLRQFTSLCEGRPPQEVLSLLNTFLTRMTGVVEENQGVVDKYMGDGLMALFGAPLEHGDDPARAVQAARAMSAALADVNADLGRAGLPAVAAGVGVHTDRVVAGNVGSMTRLNYTVVGDGVNLASRLQGLTRVYGVPVIVSDATRRAAPQFAFREIDLVGVRGRREPVAIHEPLDRIEGLTPEARARLAAHHEALRSYRGRDWDGARARFDDLRQAAPEVLLYRVYLDRIEQLRSAPPGPEWDGSFHHVAK